MDCVSVVGGGFAGCEAALWLAGAGVRVRLYEQKPLHFSPAHTSGDLAEPVCSNSFKAERPESAGGLLKAEMRLLGSGLLPIADECRVPAGGALAVNRELFGAAVTRAVQAHPLIELRREQVTRLGESLTVVATGPLTGGALAQELQRLAGCGMLSFYDAAAPIVSADSLDTGLMFAAARYGRGDADYLNAPLDRQGYEAFHAALVAAETAPLRDFDARETHYEGCMPVEALAKRGADTLRYGPLRPVGLADPATGRRPWACVQLRREDAEGAMYNLVGFQTNLKFPEQRRVFGMIPGLARAEFVRFGAMHRNTFLNSPAVLNADFSLKGHPNILLAGQITGVEGYMESAASGLLAARAALARLRGAAFRPPPPESMCGALCRYLAAPNAGFQPMGANMGLLPPGPPARDRQQRYGALALRALAALRAWEAGNRYS